MRPVEKGSSPVAAFSAYQDAVGYLQQRLGRYCSYCERRLETNLAVEHVRPKSKARSLELTWGNFLVACPNCNSCKGDTDIVLSEYLWPDLDNTLRALRYTQGGVVQVDASIPAPLLVKAHATRGLVGLDREPGSRTLPTESDLRWNRRREAWSKATIARDRLAKGDSVALREQIADTAQETGMFSIWWEVFSADPDMRRRFRQAFTGTCAQSFDPNEDLKPRSGGQL